MEIRADAVIKLRHASYEACRTIAMAMNGAGYLMISSRRSGDRVIMRFMQIKDDAVAVDSLDIALLDYLGAEVSHGRG